MDAGRLEETLLRGCRGARHLACLRSARLWPLKRARHVLTESARLHAFAAACLRRCSAGADGLLVDLAELGVLMDASHASCRDDYDCSSASLEALVTTMKDAGALGARLTGAGWGGCAIALVRRQHVRCFLDTVWDRFYAPGHPSLHGQELLQRRAEVLFETRPGAGASLLLNVL